MAMSLIRWLQFAVAIAGLIFAASSHFLSAFLVIAFVLALVYEIILFVGYTVGKEVFSGRGQMIADIVIAVLLFIATIIVTVDGNGSEVLRIFAIICGFLLGALLIITAYHG
jgi:hypothetical protein